MVNMDMIANNPNLARRVKHLTGCANLQVVRAWYALFNLGGMAERLRRNFYYRIHAAWNRSSVRGTPFYKRWLRCTSRTCRLQVVRAWYALFNLGGMAERLRRNFY
ncbi:hypothetical protein PPROV_000628500 [Pycnococcus provasolii]|uniref:Uncharacterized protein n=1 Tax=Pycnococcus provasolii TaxID=41880 RepID=A0A830HLL4_9CHLO|nr:hypothetical protein PPROV_000628500 [Pycnococcus provasolii]